MLAELGRRAGLSATPALYDLFSPMMTASTTGAQRNAAPAVSDGSLRRLGLHEVAGVLAHEVRRIANDDIRVMSFADLASRMTGPLSLLGQVLLVLTAPLALAGAELPPLISILHLLGRPG